MKNRSSLKITKKFTILSMVMTLFWIGNLQAQEQIVRQEKKLTLRSGNSNSYSDPYITLDGAAEYGGNGIALNSWYRNMNIFSGSEINIHGYSGLNLSTASRMNLKSHYFIFQIHEAQLEDPNASIKVGIGTDPPDEMLTVNGKIHTKGVKIDLEGWPDYVFENTYNLPTLTQVEAYIKNNGHLKNVPSVAEVKEKGIELGQMNKVLLQKIEELTLYTIDQEKQLTRQNSNNEQLKASLQKLKHKNEVLETRLAKIEEILTKG